MSAYFAFKAEPGLATDLEYVLARLDEHSPEPQADLYVKMSMEFTDSVLKTILLDLVKAMGSKSGILEQLASVLRGTMHMLLRQLLSKRSNSELEKAAMYVHARRRYRNGDVYIAIPIPDSLRTHFETVFTEIDAGRGESNREELRLAMSQFVDQAVTSYFDEFVAALQPGFILGKAAGMARATIAKGAHAAMNKMIPHLTQAELQGMADYFDQLLLSDPEITLKP
ncbi:MAG: hypothetical protein HKM02_04770 [Pseudomonadales bacterium]|nr:hypothetical protein [Pseudomonadales bacterium]